ncbi:TrfB-related DNA-binding protein [Glaciimonas sp. Cout2]|uniref:TrfB-related DNA-binding protein n=1 Tax=Glaciimonas sp. Cout2 TaxID=3048621 RepID=UPI002B222E3D|nr:TrfB-related DNA-binding protein [Glaciimonas sp. Cout2]MEB0014486.1 TrfB-related DNA-binding protein [Glaciimonas sp. Cout2]
MKKIRLTAEQFDALVSKTRLKDKGIAYARAALVDGRGYTEIANELGISRAEVYQAANIVLKQFEPEGFESHTYTGPAEMFSKIERTVAEFGGVRIA